MMADGRWDPESPNSDKSEDRSNSKDDLLIKSIQPVKGPVVSIILPHINSKFYRAPGLNIGITATTT